VHPRPPWFFEGSEGLVFPTLVLNSVDGVEVSVEIAEPAALFWKGCSAGIAV
jgi:hypothetical protein